MRNSMDVLHGLPLIVSMVLAGQALAAPELPPEVDSFLRADGQVTVTQALRSGFPDEQMVVHYCGDIRRPDPVDEWATVSGDIHCAVALFAKRKKWIFANQVIVGQGTIRAFRDGVVVGEVFDHADGDRLCCPTKRRDVAFSTSSGKIVATTLSQILRRNAPTELEQRKSISDSVGKSFLAEDFSRLETMSETYRKEKSRTSSGLWNLTLFYAGIIEAIRRQTVGEDFDAQFRILEAKTKKWAMKYPRSPSAHIARSIVLIRHGWAHRGSGYASTVKPESWAPFHQYITMARENLEKHKSVASVDPTWYETMLKVARDQGWDRSEFDALLNEALKREPLYYQTYFQALEYLLPKWHGEIVDIEVFARDAVSRTRTQEGQGMYARIYWYASQTEFENVIFSNSLAIWPRMKVAFEDVISRYPDAWNLSNYAKFACLARDKPKTAELLTRMGSTVVPEAWSPPYLQEQCTEWAFKK
jgi:hypothetical protein